MIDLYYGENYQEGVDLKKEIEKRIAEKLDVSPKHVLLNYGSNSNLILVFSAFSLKYIFKKGRKLKILLDIPNYFFSIKQLSEWFVETILVERESDFELSIDKFLKAIQDYLPDLILITTPNNPTGKVFGDKDLDRILNQIPEETIVILDRSCVNVLSEIETKSLLKKYPTKKVIVLHSFSKSHSLSNERLGYLVTNDPEIAEFLSSKRDLNHHLHALKKCFSLLDDQNKVEEKKKILQSCHGILKKYFDDEKKGKYFESFSNFALLRLPNGLTSEELEEKMRAKGILIMGGHAIGLTNEFVRIHMTSPEQIEVFLMEYDRLIKSSEGFI